LLTFCLFQNSSQPKRPPNPLYTCSQCGEPCSETRALHRHLWAKHPEFAEQNKTPSEKKKCPFAGCGYYGRKDNVLRHHRLKHQK
ncbi:hypothetical protein QBC43DRAFT_212206, partial [Cladorrhinum sp. PSN259]